MAGAQDANANAVELRGSGTAAAITIAAVGDDTDISMRFAPKGAGVVQFASGINSTGNSTIIGALSVSGASTFGGRIVGSSGLSITGASTLGTIQAGASTVTSISVTGASTFGGRIVGSSGLEITGASTFGTIQAGNSTITGALSVSGTSTFSGRIVGSSGLQITGATTLGTLVAGASSVASLTVGSGLTLDGIYSTTFVWTLAAISSGQWGEITLASTTADVLPGDLLTVQLDTIAADLFQGGYRQSTAAASRVTVLVGNITSTATSTQSGTGRITWLSLA